MKKRAEDGRAWATALAVFALLAWSVLAGLADTASAHPQSVDSLGNPICASHGSDDAGSPPGLPGNHEHHADCCFAGCNTAGGHALTPEVGASLLLRPFATAYAALSDYRLADNTPEWTPLNPRAPPTA
jgi:hypothetical protein